jgi:uncharacterized protein YkwD
MRTALPLAAVVLAVACNGSSTARGARAGSAPQDEPLERPKGTLDLEQAQRYVLTLVNRDREKHGLEPVVWDEAAAKAGQRQADDMGKNGFTAHIGSDGSVPELRYTEAGGDGMVMENVGCVADGEERDIARDPKFSPESLERVQKAFMDEVPPMDGHKRNILTKWHTSLGVGLAQPKGFDIACMAQEFVDDYGDYDELPDKATVGSKLRIGGRLRSPAVIAGVGVARIDKPKPRKPKDLNRTGGYAIPKPFVTYFTRGFKTPIVVDVNGNAFGIEVPLQEGAGLYEISVWAKLPQSKDLLMVSLRTLEVR